MTLANEMKAVFVREGTFRGLEKLAEEYIDRERRALEATPAADAVAIAGKQAEIRLWRAIAKIEAQVLEYAASTRPSQQS